MKIGTNTTHFPHPGTAANWYSSGGEFTAATKTPITSPPTKNINRFQPTEVGEGQNICIMETSKQLRGETATMTSTDMMETMKDNSGAWDLYNLNGQAQDLPLQYSSLLHFRKPALSQFSLMPAPKTQFSIAWRWKINIKENNQ